MSGILTLKTINELRDIDFYIPSYQRGYRWTDKEVIDLLNDIKDFDPRPIDDSSEKTWYCLQPIVVAEKDNGRYEVIDGQQRLTTIYLIIKYFNNRLREPEHTFSLSYQTRDNSAEFLDTVNKDEINSSNVDFYYMSRAYSSIYNWFDKSDIDKNEFESKFKYHSRVIWYEPSENDPIEIFTRINIGKIPLTNSELIKALFLNSSNFEKNQIDKIRLKQLEISTEWDYIEHSLQNDRFWYFLCGKKTEVNDNRIEFIFDLMNDEKDSNDKYSTFRFFNQKFLRNNQDTIESNWKDIKSYFQRFQEWYEERELYHKIGYLVAIDAVDIEGLYRESSNLTKSQFRDLLDEEVRRSIKGVDLENIQYGDRKVKSVLLLYNILTMLKSHNDNSYFPFNIFKNGSWDIEHITSIRDSIPIKKQEWLNDAKTFIDTEDDEGKKLKADADNFSFDTDNDEGTAFEGLFYRIVKHFNKHIEDNDIDDISNLTLLDSETNRGYKNAVFPLKRKTIIDREKNGTFIPICTKNVFLKYFSSYPPKISFWTQEDRDNYFIDLESTLSDYLNKGS